MPYVTVFDITQKPFEWWWAAFGLIFVVIGAVLIKTGPKLDRNKSGKKFGLTFPVDSRLLGWFFVIFASGWTLVAFSSTYSTYREYVQAYQTGRYSVVEGLVEDFHPMPYEGHPSECFRVNRENFCYSDYVVSPGFNQSASHGGPIRAGLPVRIAYVEGEGFQEDILRLEIRADSLTPETERMAQSKAEEEKWNQREKDYLARNQFLLGFSFAAVLIALCWNLDWEHYVRYWIWRDPPYSKFLELGFRAFFLACLVSSSIAFARTITEKHRTLNDFGQAALYSLIPIGVFGLYDLISRRRLRAKDRSTDRPTSLPSNL